MEGATPSPPARDRPPRPTSLSVPCVEWSEADRSAIPKTPDDRPTWWPLQALHGSLAAGGFDEDAWLLPVTPTFLREGRENAEEP